MSEKKNSNQDTSAEPQKSAKELKLEMRKKYADLAKNSLVRTQYSCSGNSNDIDESDYNMPANEDTNR